MTELTSPNEVTRIARPPYDAVIIMGVCGTGKSTIARMLAARTGWKYLDADDYHPATNLAKMRANIPLDDDDRIPWLDQLADALRLHAAAHQPAVLACSALKQAYRERLETSGADLRWVFLHGSFEVLRTRLLRRMSHFMPATLLESQLAALEPPNPANALWVDIEKSPSRIISTIRTSLVER